MLKKLVLIVLVFIFAKPAYDLVMDVQQNDFVETIVMTESLNQPVKEELALSETAKSVDDLTDAFYYHFQQLEVDFKIEYKGNTSKLGEMLEQAGEEAAMRNDYIKGHLDTRQVVYEYSPSAAKIQVEQLYLTNLQQEQRVDQLVTRLVQSIPAETSVYNKVKFVNDYIVKNTVYSENTSASPHSAYAVAIEGKGVCQGYALFAYKLLDALGVEVRYVTGEVASGGHAWNLVNVDGSWYHLDTTWNDPLPDRGQEVRYDYFLISDAEIARDHYWEKNAFPAALQSY